MKIHPVGAGMFRVDRPTCQSL